jgi:hypothetical protein
MNPNDECTASHHHWLIEEAHGERSAGLCKHCHARRSFRNWLADGDFIGRAESRLMHDSASVGQRGNSGAW